MEWLFPRPPPYLFAPTNTNKLTKTHTHTKHTTGWEKLYTKEGVPFWTNHNERTTSWDPPSLPTPSPTPGSALPTGEVQSSLGQGQGHVVPGASPNSSKFESVDAPAGAIAVAAAAASGQEKRPSLGADGKPLPEG